MLNVNPWYHVSHRPGKIRSYLLLVQVMTNQIFSVEPIPGPMLISVTSFIIQSGSLKKLHLKESPAKCLQFCSGLNVLNINHSDTETGIILYMPTRSIPLLLMPWFLVLPNRQHPWPWYCICKIDLSLSSMKKNFSYLYHLRVERWQKTQIYFYFS